MVTYLTLHSLKAFALSQSSAEAEAGIRRRSKNFSSCFPNQKKDPTCFPTTNGKNRNYLNRIPIFLNRQDFFVPLTGNRSDERRSGKRSGCRPDLGTPGGPVRHLGLVSVPALCRNVQLSFHSSCRVEQTRCDQRSLAASGSVSIWMGDRFRQILHIWAHHCWLCFVFRSSQP